MQATDDELRCANVLLQLISDPEYKERFYSTAKALALALLGDFPDPVEAYLLSSFLKDSIKAKFNLQLELKDKDEVLHKDGSRNETASHDN